MKKLLAVLLCLGLVGCATMATNINSVQLGMSKDEVIKTMGQPVSTSAIKGTEYLNYSLWEKIDNTGFAGRYVPYYVSIKDGKVIAFGRTGDFDSTKDPTQVIKIFGDVKSDEKANVQTDNSDLESKLKTLNKLLADGVITQDDFNQQKAKLLNEYTSK